MRTHTLTHGTEPESDIIVNIPVNVGYNFSKSRAHIYCNHLLLFVNCFAIADRELANEVKSHSISL